MHDTEQQGRSRPPIHYFYGFLASVGVAWVVSWIYGLLTYGLDRLFGKIESVVGWVAFPAAVCHFLLVWGLLWAMVCLYHVFREEYVGRLKLHQPPLLMHLYALLGAIALWWFSWASFSLFSTGGYWFDLNIEKFLTGAFIRGNDFPLYWDLRVGCVVEALYICVCGLRLSLRQDRRGCLLCGARFENIISDLLFEGSDNPDFVERIAGGDLAYLLSLPRLSTEAVEGRMRRARKAVSRYSSHCFVKDSYGGKYAGPEQNDGFAWLSLAYAACPKHRLGEGYVRVDILRIGCYRDTHYTGIPEYHPAIQHVVPAINLQLTKESRRLFYEFAHVDPQAIVEALGA